MGARDRTRRYLRAKERGEEAFWRGEPFESCPLKVSEWGSGGFWQLGWREAERAAKAGVRHALYGNPLTDRHAEGDNHDI